MKEFTCIVCPAGCTLKYEDGVITGNKCDRGEAYGMAEATNPVRTVTSTVATDKGGRCPVRTKLPIPKDKMLEVMKIVEKTTAKCPVAVGDVLVKDICGTGVDLVATANVQ